MRFLFLALLLIAGILGAVVLVQKGQARIAAEAKAAAEARETASSATASATVQATPLVPAPVTAGPDPAVSVAVPGPAAPAGSAAAVAPPARKPADPVAPAFQVVAKPAIAAAGVLETTRGRVTLKDIVPLDPTEMCGQGAATWPCGQLAATQFRRFLRGRSVNCDIADPAWQGDVTARCTLGKEDVGSWLVEQGWTRARAGSSYEEAGRKAQADKRGIFAPDPRHP